MKFKSIFFLFLPFFVVFGCLTLFFLFFRSILTIILYSVLISLILFLIAIFYNYEFYDRENLILYSRKFESGCEILDFMIPIIILVLYYSNNLFLYFLINLLLLFVIGFHTSYYCYIYNKIFLKRINLDNGEETIEKIKKIIKKYVMCSPIFVIIETLFIITILDFIILIFHYGYLVVFLLLSKKFLKKN